MIKTRHLCATSLLAACLSIGGPAFAHGGGDMDYRGDCEHKRGWFKGKHHGGPMGRIKHMIHHLDLSDEQRDQVYAVMDEARPKFRGLMDEMREQRKSFRDLAIADEFDPKDAEAAAEAQSELMKQMMLTGAQVKADIFEILTPEQREEVKERMQKRRRFF